MELIGETIKNILEDWQKNPRMVFLEEVLEELKRILNRRQLRHITPGRFYQGVLYFKVDSTPWLYHFNLYKENLLGKLKESLPIKDIRFYVGERDEKKAVAGGVKKKG
ncbi:MAG: DUF721 domain-containing protein [Candidatus Omnitrophica bacterium]|nr:DUF721 domain-containing protein [Candidatus Omnitrophota bacterium]